MGLTYAQSFTRSHIADKHNLMLLVKTPDKAKALASRDIGLVYNHPSECLPFADLVILAVKPQDAPSLFNALRPYTAPQQVYLSIMAGVTTGSICQGIGVSKVIRAMPNLPAQIGMGMTAFTSTEDVTRIELVMVQNLLNTTGKTIYVEEEKLINAATAISGSGPAYVFFFMKALMSAALEMGFSESEAELLVSQTFSGTTDLYNKANYTCEEWIQKVASRGGTTEAALRIYEQTTLYDDIINGARAALQRAVELGN